MEEIFCNVCKSKSEKVFSKKILGKYDVSYYKCVECGFVQTDKPYWLKESYSDAITSLDIGLVNRNIQYSNIIEDILYKYFNKNGRFLDFAGGYGMFTRIMRDKGFDFYHEDKYCENIFAKCFTKDDLPNDKRKFELVTAFELMEHSEDPFREFNYIFSITDNFLFSTELIPDGNIENWWYLAEEHGQHISFYTKKTLKKIAEKYNKNYYSNGYLHLFTNKVCNDIFKIEPRWKVVIGKILKELKVSEKLISKTQTDFEMIKKGENSLNLQKE